LKGPFLEVVNCPARGLSARSRPSSSTPPSEVAGERKFRHSRPSHVPLKTVKKLGSQGPPFPLYQCTFSFGKVFFLFLDAAFLIWYEAKLACFGLVGVPPAPSLLSTVWNGSGSVQLPTPGPFTIQGPKDVHLFGTVFPFFPVFCFALPHRSPLPKDQPAPQRFFPAIFFDFPFFFFLVVSVPVVLCPSFPVALILFFFSDFPGRPSLFPFPFYGVCLLFERRPCPEGAFLFVEEWSPPS